MDISDLWLWIHLAAIVTWVGLWFNTLFVFNSLRKYVADATKADFISAYRKRYLTVTWAAIVVFIITGTILMETNENYPGLAHFFTNSWATLVATKHAIVVLMIAISFTVLYGTLPKLRAAFIARDQQTAERLMQRERLAVVVLCVLGLAVLAFIDVAAGL
jgi:uncharacterized membrane protein